MKQQSSFRERYRVLVSWLIIPLGLIIMVRASMIGLQAWTLIGLGLAFVALGIVRLRAHYAQHMHSQNRTLSRRKQV
jgi:uncharacterized membrane protein (DUF373 family)